MTLNKQTYIEIFEELGLTYRIEPNENIVICRNHELILTCVFFWIGAQRTDYPIPIRRQTPDMLTTTEYSTIFRELGLACFITPTDEVIVYKNERLLLRARFEPGKRTMIISYPITL